ncbi:NADPH-dependent 1-acyl dihydroxyacetone phosphate reductase [Neonectria magnoliae]|uniref:NADPH-dependent 1-acyl dihydroxyacetone phosphate reductase n=1 Tax=Neonectria magnoliae TaxID=2732573 RepID=A0ABR1HEB3_9HYPO
MAKYVLITGCSVGGIGNALARAFASRGINVFATARDASRMENLTGLPNITLITLDVTSYDQIAEAIQKVSEVTGGTLDYLINNSGQHSTMPALDSDMDTARRLFDVNFWAVLQMTQSFTPLLITARENIINIGSIAGVTPFPSISVYSASKAALHAFDTALWYEIAPFGVDVITVITGAVQSRIADNALKLKLPNGSRYFQAEELLETITLGKGTDGSRMTKIDVYAQRVLDDIL